MPTRTPGNTYAAADWTWCLRFPDPLGRCPRLLSSMHAACWPLKQATNDAYNNSELILAVRGPSQGVHEGAGAYTHILPSAVRSPVLQGLVEQVAANAAIVRPGDKLPAFSGHGCSLLCHLAACNEHVAQMGRIASEELQQSRYNVIVSPARSTRPVQVHTGETKLHWCPGAGNAHLCRRHIEEH